MKALLPLVLALTLPLTALAQHASVRVQVIDRGQADGIVIRTPNEKWIVIDGGTNVDQAAMMESMGVERIALAVVSHRHRDHNGGMDTILEKISTDRFLGIMDDCETVENDDDVRDALSEDTEIVGTDVGEITIDGVKFAVLGLPEPLADCPKEENNNSIVIRMDFGDFSMLFTGDAEQELLDFLVEEHPDDLDVDVLKASHHGSDNGQNAAFLEAVSPERVVISAGVHNGHKHPMAGALNAYVTATGGSVEDGVRSGGKVYCTNRHKTIRVFGRPDGGITVQRQNRIDKDCEFDGTHY